MHALTSRRSVKFLRAPAPKQDELEQILQAAMSAPDHGALRPWRFVLIRGEAIGKLADVAIGAVKRSGDPRMTPEKEKSVREWMAAVPLFIAVAQKIAHDNTKIPEQEQLLATGAAAMNLLNAVHMLGYGAFWSTGMGTYVEDVQNALGLDSLDYRFLGYLAVGTPACAVPQATRPDSVNSSRSGTVPSDRTPRASADATRRDTTRPGSGRVFHVRRIRNGRHARGAQPMPARPGGAPARRAKARAGRQGAGPRPRSRLVAGPGPCYSGRRPRAPIARDGQRWQGPRLPTRALSCEEECA